MINYPKPSSSKKLKTFVGMASYGETLYRKFIPDFADIVEPLIKLTRKNVRFDWDEKFDLAFDKIVTLLTTAPILAFSDFNKEFHVTTDASDFGLGAVLSQFNDEGEEKPIYYASRTLNKAERSI